MSSTKCCKCEENIIIAVVTLVIQTEDGSKLVYVPKNTGRAIGPLFALAKAMYQTDKRQVMRNPSTFIAALC